MGTVGGVCYQGGPCGQGNFGPIPPGLWSECNPFAGSGRFCQVLAGKAQGSEQAEGGYRKADWLSCGPAVSGRI